MALSAVQMGMDLEPKTPRKAQADVKLNLVDNTRNGAPVWTSSDENKDYFITRNGIKYAGTHLIIDLWGAKNLDNLDIMEQAMRDAVIEAKATLLHIHLHHFQPNGGISGVAVLAESHISVHTWPERGFAAFDVFMCGESEPHKAIDVLRRAFQPDQVNVGEHLRGRVDE